MIWIPGWWIEIGLTRATAELRDAITAAPFGDPDREADKSKSAEVELVIGDFLRDMDLVLFTWLDKGSQT